MGVHIGNERMKLKFTAWLKNAYGRCEGTINNIERAIFDYDEFTRGADYACFDPDKAIGFKEWLKVRAHKGKTISVSTYCAKLRYLKIFFKWLITQDGYRRKIKHDAICYLKPLDKEVRIAGQRVPRSYPTLEQVKKLTASIRVRTEIDYRDRALISLLFLAGLRIGAAITLPICCLEINKMEIWQDPKFNVSTKASKFIFTLIFKFDSDLLRYVVEWVDMLRKKGFGDYDPLFPRAQSKQGGDVIGFETATEVEPNYWKSEAAVLTMLKCRSRTAGLPYFSPHAYRHGTYALVLRFCKNDEQRKAISQSFGHEFIATTFAEYANYEPPKLREIIGGIDFMSASPVISRDEIMKAIKTLSALPEGELKSIIPDGNQTAIRTIFRPCSPNKR